MLVFGIALCIARISVAHLFLSFFLFSSFICLITYARVYVRVMIVTDAKCQGDDRIYIGHTSDTVFFFWVPSVKYLFVFSCGCFAVTI